MTSGPPSPGISTAPLTAIAMIRTNPGTSLTLGGNRTMMIIESELILVESTRGGQDHVVFARRIVKELQRSAGIPAIEMLPLRLVNLRGALVAERYLNPEARHDRKLTELDLNLGIAWNWVEYFLDREAGTKA